MAKPVPLWVIGVHSHLLYLLCLVISIGNVTLGDIVERERERETDRDPEIQRRRLTGEGWRKRKRTSEIK